MMLVHLIGNSHLNSFSGNPSEIEYINPASSVFRFYHLGPVIAYNFYEHHLPKIKSEYLPKIDKDNDYICFIVGEVDCRAHLPLQADSQGRSDEDIVAECITRFNRVYEDLSEYKFIICGTHPTTTEPHSMNNMQRPVYGDVIRRNNICVLWNKYLKQTAEKLGYPYISFYQDLVDENNITKMDYYLDYCHLRGSAVWPFIKREFTSIGIEL